MGGFLLKEAAGGTSTSWSLGLSRHLPPPPMTFGRLANISEFSFLLKRGCQGTEIMWETDVDRGSVNVLAVLLWVFSPKDPPPSTTREVGDPNTSGECCGPHVCVPRIHSEVMVLGGGPLGGDWVTRGGAHRWDQQPPRKRWGEFAPRSALCLMRTQRSLQSRRSPTKHRVRQHFGLGCPASGTVRKRVV